MNGKSFGKHFYGKFWPKGSVLLKCLKLSILLLSGKFPKESSDLEDCFKLLKLKQPTT